MFHTTLTEEYKRAQEMGLTEKELVHLIRQGFEHSFLSKEQQDKLRTFQPQL
jgi:adenosine deaminase